jgi:hypothetical protein
MARFARQKTKAIVRWLVLRQGRDENDANVSIATPIQAASRLWARTRRTVCYLITPARQHPTLCG